jgi:hypothetical protein
VTSFDPRTCGKRTPSAVKSYASSSEAPTVAQLWRWHY